MFGHDDNNQQQPTGTMDGSMSMPTTVPDDGTLGVPMMPANDLPMTVPGAMPMDTQAPSSAASEGMPPFETSMSGDPAPGRTDTNTPDELIAIKQEALQNLKPLVGHLDQSPEEKFRTTMMMIQASDDQSLIPTAYEAAKAIEDEKVRAQALLDVVNEINYFTSQNAAK